MHRLVLARARFAPELRGMLDHHERRWAPLTLWSAGEALELLAGTPATSAPEDGALLVIGAGSPEQLLQGLTGRSQVAALGITEEGRHWRALWHPEPDRPSVPVDEVVLSGWGSITLRDGMAAPPATLRFSRVAGALGEEPWQRLSAMTVGLVGSGRIGRMLALALARAGVGGLVVVDADRVGAENLDASDGPGWEDVGAFKVTALGRALGRVRPGLPLTLLSETLGTTRAAERLMACDLLVSATDDDGARWATAALAMAVLRPHLDLGTGVFIHAGQRVAGADMRLCPPGAGCLLCVGGLARPAEVQPFLLAPGRLRTAPVDFRTERAGSDPGLNLVAVGVAMGLVERLAGLGPTPRGSCWVRLDWSGMSPRLETTEHRGDPTCWLCALAGQGSATLATAVRTGRQPSEPRRPRGTDARVPAWSVTH